MRHVLVFVVFAWGTILRRHGTLMNTHGVCERTIEKVVVSPRDG